MITCGVLGPLLLRVGDRTVHLGAAKLRVVLAMLLVHRNAMVPVDRIVQEVWPEGPPDSAVANVRTYVSSLRRSLGSSQQALTTRPGAYMLAVPDDELDEALFERSTRAARAALANDRVGIALDRYAYALGLWRGEALADVPVGHGLMSHRVALTEARLNATEEYLDARFRSGDAAGAVAGLRRLLAEHPLRESGWYTLMRFLYASGDRAGALAAFRQAARTLADGLGVDPGPALMSLHIDILKGVPPAVGGPPPAGATVPAAALVPPRQLPRAPAILVGREAEVAGVRRALAQSANGEPRIPVVVAVHGPGGTGKSSLAIAAAHASVPDYPDGQLYVDLQGTSTGLAPLDPGEVLGRFLRALAVPEERISPDLSEAAAWFRSSTAQRRLLVVLDNAVDAGQVRPLLPAGPGCGVVITSRRSMATLDGAVALRLRELSAAAALQLLRRLAGSDRVNSDLAAARATVDLCGLLPLAVRVIGIRLTHHPEWELSEVVTRLRHARSRLDELGCADLDTRSTFDIGYRAVAAAGGSGPQAARLFRRLGALELSEFTATAAAALLDGEEAEAERLLEVLVDNGLVDRVRGGYRLHDLLRLYATELVQREESTADTEAAVIRVARRYIEIIRQDRVLYRPRDGDGTPPADGTVRGPAGASAGAAWLTRQLAPLGALVRQLSAGPNTMELAFNVLRPLTRWLSMHHPSECIRLYGPALAAAERYRAPGLVASAMSDLFSAYLALGRDQEAAACAERARHLLPHIDDGALRARVFAANGTAQVRTGDPALAVEYFGEAIALCERVGLPIALGAYLNNAAAATFALAWYEESLALLRRALHLARRHGDRMAVGNVLDSIAMVYVRTGRMRAAVRHATVSIAISDEAATTVIQVQSRHWRSLALQALGRTHEALADAEAAVVVSQHANRPSLHLAAVRHLAAIQWVAGSPRAADTLRRADALARAAALSPPEPVVGGRPAPAGVSVGV